LTGAVTGNSPPEGFLHYPDLDFHWISSGPKARTKVL
jgi:hypothetical protein